MAVENGKGDLISREALMQFPIRLNHFDEVNGDVKYVFGVEDVLEYAQHLPSVDAVPVVHGRWDAAGDCTVCGYPMPTDDRCDAIFPDDVKYCYHCGAKMDEEADDELD